MAIILSQYILLFHLHQGECEFKMTASILSYALFGIKVLYDKNYNYKIKTNNVVNINFTK